MQLSVFPSGLCWTILRHQPSLVAWDYLIVPKHRNIRKLLYGVQVINEICTWTMPTMACTSDYYRHNNHLIVNYWQKNWELCTMLLNHCGCKLQFEQGLFSLPLTELKTWSIQNQMVHFLHIQKENYIFNGFTNKDRQKLVLGITSELAPFYLNSTFNLFFTVSLTFNCSRNAKMIRFKIKDSI